MSKLIDTLYEIVIERRATRAMTNTVVFNIVTDAIEYSIVLVKAIAFVYRKHKLAAKSNMHMVKFTITPLPIPPCT